MPLEVEEIIVVRQGFARLYKERKMNDGDTDGTLTRFTETTSSVLRTTALRFRLHVDTCSTSLTLEWTVFNVVRAFD